ncbi:MAG: cobalamin-binding protein [Xenococcaceae cyanobacterium]
MTPSNNLRIVSLLPSATEIVAGLGLTHALVGRSHECDYPPEIQHLPVCTEARLDPAKSSLQIDTDVQTLLQSALSIYRIKTDVLEQLQPTHILTQDLCDVCAVSFSAVQKAVTQLTKSNPQLISLRPSKLTDVWADIEKVAQTLGVDSQRLLGSLRDRQETCRRQIQSVPKKIPTVVAIEWTKPIMIAGNWIPELIELAGAKPLFSVSGQNSPYLKWEEILKADPDYLIIMPCGFNLERTKQESQFLIENPYWSNLKSVRSNQVFITDGNAYFNRPSQRLIDSLEILAEIIHPELFDFGYKGTAWNFL